MVSNVLGLDADELLADLQRMRREHVGDPEYLALRAELPDEWPI